MSITVAGLGLTTQALVSTPNVYPYSTSPLTGLTVTDTATQNVTILVTQKSFLHTTPNLPTDVVIAIPDGTFTFDASSFSYAYNASNPATIDPVAHTVKATGSLTGATTATFQSSTQYSPSYLIQHVLFTPSLTKLNDTQLIESDLTVTVTDGTGAAAVSTVQALYTNPLSLFVSQVSSSQPIGATSYSGQNISLQLGSTSSSNSLVTVVVNQKTSLHSDPGAANDVVTPAGLGTWGSFVGNSGTATNVPVADTTTGSLTVTGSIYGQSSGTYNPLNGQYTSHDYGVISELNGSVFIPPLVPLTGKQTLQTDFTYKASDAAGDTSTKTTTVTYTNPTALVLTSNGNGTAAAPRTLINFSGQAFTVSPTVYSSTLTETLILTQRNTVHTHIGATDDTMIVVGPGTFATLNTGAVTATNAPTINASTGMVIASGPITANASGSFDANNVYIPVTSRAFTPFELLNGVRFTPPSLNLTGSQVLESNFTVTATDTRGDSSTASVSDFFYIPTLPSLVPVTPVVSLPVTPTATVTSLPIAGTTAPIAAVTVASPVYRFFDSGTGTHFFTSDDGERDTIRATRPDLIQETNGFGDVSAGSSNALAVFRFFDSIHGTQFLTSNIGERDSVRASRPDLIFEATNVFYEHQSSSGTGDVAVYRLFDTKLGTHFYTGDSKEYAGLTTVGSANYRVDLVSEGVAFYAPSGSYK